MSVLPISFISIKYMIVLGTHQIQRIWPRSRNYQLSYTFNEICFGEISLKRSKAINSLMVFAGERERFEKDVNKTCCPILYDQNNPSYQHPWTQPSHWYASVYFGHLSTLGCAARVRPSFRLLQTESRRTSCLLLCDGGNIRGETRPRDEANVQYRGRFLGNK